MIIAFCGPAGVGKTTAARALEPFGFRPVEAARLNLEMLPQVRSSIAVHDVTSPEMAANLARAGVRVVLVRRPGVTDPRGTATWSTALALVNDGSPRALGLAARFAAARGVFGELRASAIPAPGF